MDFLIATHNMKKRDELERILKPLGIRVLLAEQAGVELTDVDETGETYEENALLKARSGCEESGMPCIADDSGLSVDALDGAPGVYSARYAGEHGNDSANNSKLLSALSGTPEYERTAAFVSVACCVFPNGHILSARGECCGRIGYEPKGDGGFGYDPIFMPEEYQGLSMAQLSKEQKDSISHRGKSVRKLSELLGKYLEENKQ